jgi:hypothetical protein
MFIRGDEMRLGIMQPYLFPYIGYFQLINAVDKYIIYGDVQYKRKGWINRNNYLNFIRSGSQNPLLFTFKVKNDSYVKNICEREYSADFETDKKNFLILLNQIYRKAPYYAETLDVILDIFNYESDNVAEFNANSIMRISEYLGINTEFSFSSELVVPSELKSQSRTIWLCKYCEADTYINAIGGQDLYSYEDFAKEGIQLHFLKTGDVRYPQFDRVFTPNLSIVDVMMFNSPENIEKILNDYSLL